MGFSGDGGGDGWWKSRFGSPSQILAALSSAPSSSWMRLATAFTAAFFGTAISSTWFLYRFRPKVLVQAIVRLTTLLLRYSNCLFIERHTLAMGRPDSPPNTIKRRMVRLKCEACVKKQIARDEDSSKRQMARQLIPRGNYRRPKAYDQHSSWTSTAQWNNRLSGSAEAEKTSCDQGWKTQRTG